MIDPTQEAMTSFRASNETKPMTRHVGIGADGICDDLPQRESQRGDVSARPEQPYETFHLKIEMEEPGTAIPGSFCF